MPKSQKRHNPYEWTSSPSPAAAQPIYLPNGEILSPPSSKLPKPKQASLLNPDNKEEISIVDNWEAEYEAISKPKTSKPVSYILKPHARRAPEPKTEKSKKAGEVGKASGATGKKAKKSRASRLEQIYDEYDDIYAVLGEDRGRGKERTGWYDTKRPDARI